MRMILRSEALVALATLILGCGGGVTPLQDLSSGTNGDSSIGMLDLSLDDGALDLAMDLSVVDSAAADLTLAVDLPGVSPCDGGSRSCGEPGACIDCSGNTVGAACVSGVCGCQTFSDCPIGNACDPKVHKCSASCAGNLACNGGCCDGQKCQAGGTPSACGGGGGACVACGGGTPTCASGACTSTCSVGAPGAPGVCGQGFCCNAQNQCAAVGNASCGAVGATCLDCTPGVAGAVCLGNGLCGCKSGADCATNQACKNGLCSSACDGNSPCNSGCCANGTCAPGVTQTACALGMATCGSCAGNPVGSACVNVKNKIFCGCLAASDCPANQACNLATNQCSTRCDLNSPCNGGCCSAAMNGACVKGTDDTACGAGGGLCTNCPSGMGGKVCVTAQSGGQCGCNVLADCAVTAVSCTNKLCNTKCSPQQPCQVGCCSNGSCVAGTAGNACGNGGTCSDCSMNPNGTACRVTLACGCDKTSDCAMGMACNVSTHACENQCSQSQQCHGGCCSGGVMGTCLAGIGSNACGTMGACMDCSQNRLGHGCVGGNCGCTSAADCGAQQACDPVNKVCTNVCGPNQPCNGGCCSNSMCVIGLANSACGGMGNACVACKDDKPTCSDFACIGRCGGPNDGTCGNGNCCQSGQCAAGSSQTACGFQGACLDCTKQSTGTSCIAPMGDPSWYCGCNSKSDCLAAVPQSGIAGYACDIANKSCTSLCGIQGVSACNGGCCSGENGQCRAGNTDSACGLTGSFCSNCASNCSPGPKCNAMTGSCGCSSPSMQCNLFGSCFQGGINRFGCNPTTSACCVPGIYSFKDNGNPAGCCSGQSSAGVCTCFLNGVSAGNPPNLWSCCSLTLDFNGNCKCLGTNGNANLGVGPEPRACCSFQVSGNNCVCSPKGGACQSNDGCCPSTTCQNGICQ